MKAYVVTTGALFALLTIAHVARIIQEGAHVAADPWFLLTTVISVAMFVWAMRMLRLVQKS